jgi:hypothetical protein
VRVCKTKQEWRQNKNENNFPEEHAMTNMDANSSHNNLPFTVGGSSQGLTKALLGITKNQLEIQTTKGNAQHRNGGQEANKFKKSTNNAKTKIIPSLNRIRLRFPHPLI